MFRKIYAITTENDFYKFRARCSREGYTMGEALTSIVHTFANNRSLELPKKVAKKPIIPKEEMEEPESPKVEKKQTPTVKTEDAKSKSKSKSA